MRIALEPGITALLAKRCRGGVIDGVINGAIDELILVKVMSATTL